jgi:hypothetical protein
MTEILLNILASIIGELIPASEDAQHTEQKNTSRWG